MGKTKESSVNQPIFSGVKRSGLWPEASARFTEALLPKPGKVDRKVFQEIFMKAVKLAYDLWPENADEFLWNGMSVYAIDGSKNTTSLRQRKCVMNLILAADSNTAAEAIFLNASVTTVFDVFRRIPVARNVASINASEREEFKRLLPQITINSLLLFDRGFPSYELRTWIISVSPFIMPCAN